MKRLNAHIYIYIYIDRLKNLTNPVNNETNYRSEG
jgi:hypothetical protein